MTIAIPYVKSEDILLGDTGTVRKRLWNENPCKNIGSERDFVVA